MADIVLVLASSHSPALCMEPPAWVARVNDDKTLRQLIDTRGRTVDYAELLAAASPAIAAEIAPEKLAARHAQNQHAVAATKAALAAAKPDVLIMIGDDHGEAYPADNMPALAVYDGETIPYRPNKITTWPYAPALKSALWYGTEPKAYPVAAALARRLVADLVEAGFETHRSHTYAPGVSMSHAFAFVYHRLMPAPPIPTIPIHINTYFPPNQITPARCVELGRTLRTIVAGWDPKQRVAILGSGGLSHFVVDEAMDRAFLDALARRDVQAMTGIPRAKLDSGNSELRAWMAAAGAAEPLAMRLIDYVPCYRSPAGTGCGMAFATWN